MGAILAGFPRLDWLDDDKAALFPGFCLSLKGGRIGWAVLHVIEGEALWDRFCTVLRLLS